MPQNCQFSHLNDSSEIWQIIGWDIIEYVILYYLPYFINSQFSTFCKVKKLAIWSILGASKIDHIRQPNLVAKFG